MPNRSTPQETRPRTRGRRLRFATAALVLLGLAGYGVYFFVAGQTHRVGCTVEADGNRLQLDTDQAINASTIAAVAASRGLPERALAIALATSMQESRLRNLDHGDRDSLGLFQQRPSQGWGTADQIMDPVYSSQEFFAELVKIQGYSRLPLTVAAQKVQKSGYPEAYAKHEGDATLLASALTGRQGGALTCTTGEEAADGVPGDPERVREQLTREFGGQVKPRPAQGGAGGADAGDRVVQVPSSVPDQDGAVNGDGDGSGNGQRGWLLAQWAVAHAHDLKIAKVSFLDRQWRAADSGKGWQKSDTSAGVAVDEDVRIAVAQ